MKVLTQFTLSVVAVAALTSSSSFANNVGYEARSGSQCQAAYGSQEKYFTKLQNGIRNATGSSLWIDCPIDRGLYTQVHSGMLVSGTNNGSYNQMKCYTKVMNLAGTGVLNQQVRSFSSGAGTVYFPPISNSGGAWSTFGLTCLLPRYSTLHSFSIRK